MVFSEKFIHKHFYSERRVLYINKLSCCLVAKSYLTNSFARVQWRIAIPASSVTWDSPGKSTGMGCRFLLQGNLPNPGIEPGSPASQADSLPPVSPGKLPKGN